MARFLWADKHAPTTACPPSVDTRRPALRLRIARWFSCRQSTAAGGLSASAANLAKWPTTPARAGASASRTRHSKRRGDHESRYFQSVQEDINEGIKLAKGEAQP